MKMTHGSLFSGIGGFDLSAARVGLKNVYACEIDKYCRDILRRNFNHKIVHDDVESFNPPYVDVISAGFPCQDISISGKGAGIDGKQSGLFAHVVRITNAKKAKYVVLENVAMLRSRGLARVLKEFATIGYDAQWSTIPASAVGRGHKRERIWIVAYPHSERWTHRSIFDKCLQTALRKKRQETQRKGHDIRGFDQTVLHSTHKRIERTGDFSSLRLDDGISKELDKKAIMAYGNAVVVDIAECILERILDYKE